MMMRWFVGLTTLGLIGCGGGSNSDPEFSSSGQSESAEEEDGDAGDSGDDEGIGMCGECLGNAVIECDEAGNPTGEMDCGDLKCVSDLGCVPCSPGGMTCVDNGVYSCTDDGQPGELLEECDASAGEICNLGSCADACEAASETPSNIGCEFWAADLPNTRGLDSTVEEPWGVVLANASEMQVSVIVERNIAPLGDPKNLVVVAQTEVPAGGLKAIELPQAELTGWAPDNVDPTGTQVTAHGFRIRATGPIVVYQFNQFTNNFSTDASLLLPANGLGTVHRVIGYPTANPIAVPGLSPMGIPDRSSVAVLATQDGTNVSVRPSTTTNTDMMSIPLAGPGDTINVTLDAFDVLNLASDGIPGDMTGTVVESDKPVSVFSVGERAIGPVLLDPPEPPNYDPEGLCCTDHLEEQVFPAQSLGSTFVISRSPLRSSSGYAEPDILRFLAVSEPATVTTNLAPPWDSFTLQPGDVMNAWAQADAVVESTAPLYIAQILVSQGFTEDVTGDPSLTMFAPIEQYRDIYVFLTPPTWTTNYFVIAAPKGAPGSDGGGMGSYTLDGGPLPDDCIQNIAGSIGGTEYETIRCPVNEGAHTLSGDQPFGLTAYGYGSAGSYAFAGGADVKPIYMPPPIP